MLKVRCRRTIEYHHSYKKRKCNLQVKIDLMPRCERLDLFHLRFEFNLHIVDATKWKRFTGSNNSQA